MIIGLLTGDHWASRLGLNVFENWLKFVIESSKSVIHIWTCFVTEHSSLLTTQGLTNPHVFSALLSITTYFSHQLETERKLLENSLTY